MGDQLDDVRDRLQGIADDLADLALERLRAAVGSEEPDRLAAEERRLTKARRAVDKAIAVLSGGAAED